MRFFPTALIHRARDESGAALVMGLGILMTMTVMLTGTLEMTASGGRDAALDNAQQSSYALAEAGLNNAISVLEANYPGAYAYPGNSSLLPMRRTDYAEGYAMWGGTLSRVTGKAWAWQWSLSSTGRIENPTGPQTDPATRTVTAVVPIVMPPTSNVGSTSVLNWLFALHNATFNNQVSIASPLYAGGDLTLDQKATVAGTAGKLAVGGKLTMSQNADGVGSSASRIGEAHLVGGCAYKGNGTPPPLHTPCLWDTDNVYAAVGHRDSTIPSDLLVLPTLTCCSFGGGAVPPSTMAFWYINASPGPNSPCDAASKTGAPPTFDTGDGIINNSATPSTPFNLTPYNQSYMCKTVGTGGTIGELSWNATTMVLTIKGTVFIDGSATVDKTGYSGQPVFIYRGQGTIYLSGTFSVKSAKLCAVAAASDCDTTAGKWDPNANALIVVADGDGGAGGAQSQGNVVKAGDGIDLVSASYQGALVAYKNIQVDTTTNDQGPMISVYNSVNSGQTGTLTFPSTSIAPSGLDGLAGPVPAGNLLAPISFGG